MASVIYDRPIILDSTGQEIVDKLDSIANSMDNAIIDDSAISASKTWSSQKLNTNFNNITNKIPNSASSSNQLVDNNEMQSAISTAVSSAYHAAGTKTVAELIPSLLTSSHEGDVYNITDSGVTTSDFIEGAGHPINIGDNVGVAKINNVYKFDLLSGFIDTSIFQTKTLSNPITIGGASRSTVESALNALENNKEDKLLLATPLYQEYDEIMHQNVTKIHMDDEPTEDSDYPVTSDGVYNSIEDNSTYLQTLLEDTVGYKRDNLLFTKIPNMGVDGVSVLGLYFGDDPIEYQVSGKPETQAYIETTPASITVKAGHYKLSGCPNGGGNTTYELLVYQTATNPWTIIGIDTGDGAEFNIVNDGDIAVAIRVYDASSGTVFFKPMITRVEYKGGYVWGYDSISNIIGKLSSLKTTIKTSIVNAINEIVDKIPSNASSSNKLATKSDIPDLGLSVIDGKLCVRYEK